MTESDILDTALENLEKITTAKTKVIKSEARKNEYNWDALVSIQAGRLKESFKVEIKRTVQLSQLVHLFESLQKEKGLLVAHTIPIKSKEVLKDLGINYLDSAGNCFIRTEGGLFWHISGKKQITTLSKSKNKAFSKNGIKLIFALMLEPYLVYSSYRALADIANISVGSIGDILKDLREKKFLIQRNQSTILLENRKELLDRWVTAYNERLKPNLFRGKFRFTMRQDEWKLVQLPHLTHWGGEPAGEILTNNLYPNSWTIYTAAERTMLIKNSRFVPDNKNGLIEAYKPFWNVLFVQQHKEKLSLTNTDAVHPLIAYADLSGSHSSRNLEIAKKIYEQYLKNTFE